jgi:predicted DNA-binding transcriptional regulator AlpA
VDLIELRELLTEQQKRTQAEMKALRREVRQLRAELSVLHKKPSDLVDVNEAAAVLGIAGKTLRNRISVGEFPRPDQLITNGGRKRRGWLMKDVLEHKLGGE